MARRTSSRIPCLTRSGTTRQSTPEPCRTSVMVCSTCCGVALGLIAAATVFARRDMPSAVSPPATPPATAATVCDTGPPPASRTAPPAPPAPTAAAACCAGFAARRPATSLTTPRAPDSSARAGAARPRVLKPVFAMSPMTRSSAPCGCGRFMASAMREPVLASVGMLTPIFDAP